MSYLHQNKTQNAPTKTALGQRGLQNDVVLELVTEPLARGAEGKQMVKWYQGEDVDEPNLEGQSVRVWLLLNSLSIRHHAHVGFPLVGNSTREYLVEVSRQEAWK
jgi:hypothetical protein